MTETEEDRSLHHLETAMGRREQTAWTNFVLSLGTGDVFYMDDYRLISTKRHTWAQKKPTPQWSRVDRFYVNPEL
jgi:hypothetical protein